MTLVEIFGHARKTAGVIQAGPAGGLVSGAAEELAINETFDRHDGMAPARLPILGEAGRAQGQRPRSQIGQLLPVGEDAVTGVVGQEMASPLELIVVPADPLIAPGQVTGGGAPADQGQPLAFVLDDVAEVLAHEDGVAQVVLLGHQFVPAGKLLLGDEADLEPIKDLLFLGIGQSNGLGHARKISKRGRFVHFFRHCLLHSPAQPSGS